MNKRREISVCFKLMWIGMLAPLLLEHFWRQHSGFTVHYVLQVILVSKRKENAFLLGYKIVIVE